MNDEYISKEAFIRQICLTTACSYYGEFVRIIKDFPAADVQPVKHGAWSKDEQGYDAYVECSECGLNLSVSDYIENEWRENLKYCPCCGARMDLNSVTHDRCSNYIDCDVSCFIDNTPCDCAGNIEKCKGR